MQLKLNREFAMRHIGVAVLFAALCGWFAWDGGLAWPAENAAWEKRTGITVGAAAKAHTEERYAHNKEGRDDIPPHWPWEIDRQFQFAGLCGLAALIIGAGVLRCSRQSLVWNDTQMCGSLTDGEPVAFDDIVECDTRKWKKKGILTLRTKSGRKIPLDSWHHNGVKELAEKCGVKD